jgi:hypothetical protein
MSSLRDANGLNTSRSYTVGPLSNQLTGFIQSINGGSSTSVTYGYNANGDLVSVVSGATPAMPRAAWRLPPPAPPA